MASLGETCVNEHITDVECLNENHEFPVKNLFARGDATLKSDTDHQLLIKIQFRQPVKISGLRFTAVNEESMPTDVKVFINQPHMGFGEADDTPSTQDLCLNSETCNLAGKKDAIVPVKYVKFQNVSDLQIFVSENAGSEVTELKLLEIFGTTAEKSDIASWKPVKG